MNKTMPPEFRVKIDQEKCRKCKRCLQSCSFGVYEFHDRVIPDNDKCVACNRCVTMCPESAVACPIDWALFRPFISWNVKRALRDPLLDRTPVALRRGKVVRLDDAESHPRVER